MDKKPKKKAPRRSKIVDRFSKKKKGPRWSFDFLGIPCGDEIEFRFGGVSVAGRGEKFVVANQKRSVKCLHEGEVHSRCELKVFTNILLEERNLLEGKNIDADKKRRSIEFWRHCKTKRKLDDIYKKYRQ